MEKKHLFPAITILLSLLLQPAAMAEIRLPAIFGDNMVLQRNTDVAFWGSATPGSRVTIKTSWNGKSYSVRAGTNGKWKTKVQTPEAGGPYSVTLSDGKSLTISNILIGEVWVCSGQSNMEMTMKGYINQPVVNSNDYIATSANNSIRLITVQREVSLTPVEEIKGEWRLCEPSTVAGFSATAYFFGLMLNRVLDVPVGLISTSWSGTRIEPWMTEESLSTFDWVKLPDKSSTETNIPVQTPTVLYNGMISPVAGFGIKGAIWYQGESNRLEPARYLELLPAMIKGWRAAWEIGDFAFYYAQIAPFDYGPGEMSSAYLREAQLKAVDYIINSGMACLMDTGEKDNIHPADKKAAGDRLAFQALSKTYGIGGIACDGPVLKEMTVEGNIIKLTFDNAPFGLTSYGNELNSFEVAGATRRFYPAKAFITGSGITVICPNVSAPVAVRYAFRDFVKGELFNTEGLPASSFRTDNW